MSGTVRSFSLVFQTGSLSVLQALLELAMQTRLASNPQTAFPVLGLKVCPTMPGSENTFLMSGGLGLAWGIPRASVETQMSFAVVFGEEWHLGHCGWHKTGDSD